MVLRIWTVNGCKLDCRRLDRIGFVIGKTIVDLKSGFCSRGFCSRAIRGAKPRSRRELSNPEGFCDAPFAARTLLRGANCAVQKWILNCDFCAAVVQFWLFRLSDVI